MDPNPSPDHPPARGRALLIVGVVMLALGGASYSLASADVDRTDFVPAGAPAVRDGTATQTYVVPRGTDVLASGTIMGMYRFHDRAGDVHVLGCEDHQRFLEGAPLGSRATVLHDVRAGMFHVDAEPLVSDAATARCSSDVYVVLSWDDAGDWRSNPPSAVTELVQNPKMDGPLPMLLMGGAAAGAIVAILGIVSLRRERRAARGQ